MLYSKDAAVKIRIYKNFTSRRISSPAAPKQPCGKVGRTGPDRWGPRDEQGQNRGFRRRLRKLSGKALCEWIFSAHEHIPFLEALAGRPQPLMTRRY